LVAVRAELLLEPADIARHHRPDVGVDRRRRRTLRLENLRQDLEARADVDAGELRLQDLLRAALVRRVDGRVDEDDRDGLEPDAPDAARDPAHALLVERDDDLAAIVEPLVDLEAVAARHERRRRLPPEVEHVLAVAAADLEDVAEAARRD